MNRILVAAILFTTASALAEDHTFERTLNVSRSPKLSVSTGSGHIHLSAGSDNQIHITGHIHSGHGWLSGNMGSPEARMQQIASNPPIAQSGDEVTIGERHSTDLFRNISIDYEITLPAASNINAGSGSGDIEIQNVGASLKVDTGSGNVRAHGVAGAADLQTGSGDIDFSQTASGDVHTQTGSGSIHISSITGGLKAGTGSGDIDVSGNPTNQWKLETGSGSIRLSVGPSAKFTVDANTGSGTIHIDQPFSMQGDLNRHHVTASVNGGGPVVKAETGSGNIKIN